ncbi:MAG: hypothetical protein OCD76_07295 [Reichenbachiella sp.]
MKLVSITKKPQDEWIVDVEAAVMILLNQLIVEHGVSHLAVIGLLESCKLQYLQADEEEE